MTMITRQARARAPAPTRRDCLRAAACALAGPVILRPAYAGNQLQDAILAWTGGAPPQVGRVRFEVAALVDNGNTVPMTVRVDSPMSPSDHVQAIAVFNERNPQPDIARFTLGPHAGRAEVSTRMRLATSQKLAAVARLSDGSYWQQTVDVIVTIAACIEDPS